MSSFSSLPSSNSSSNNQSEDMLFEVNDYLAFSTPDEGQEEACMHCPAALQNPLMQANECCHAEKNKITDRNKSKNAGRTPSSLSLRSSVKVAFKTRSELEILDDGYKWRKYGKKMVKSNTNPRWFYSNYSSKLMKSIHRNYYRCSREGCNVKKRVERHQEDSRFVITTYEGVHNHHAPYPAVLTQHRAIEYLTLMPSPDKHH